MYRACTVMSPCCLSAVMGCAGSARTVNRRYIALFVAFKDRTWASALFVSLSAVGMALGPLLSLPLSLFPTTRFAGLTFDHVSPSPRHSHACRLCRAA